MLGQITTVAEYAPTGQRVGTRWRWDGGDVVAVRRKLAGRRDAKPGDRLRVGPWVLRVLAVDYPLDGYWCEYDGWRAWLRSRWWPFKAGLERSYWRCLATLAVWGLARWSDTALPTWRDVHALRYLARRFKEN